MHPMDDRRSLAIDNRRRRGRQPRPSRSSNMFFRVCMTSAQEASLAGGRLRQTPVVAERSLCKLFPFTSCAPAWGGANGGRAMIANRTAAEPDIVLVGAGIMSATLGTVLKELEPTLNIVLFETLHDCALESSEGWNNAGTGHAANCELNYTPQRPDGSVDISKALEVNTEFDLSRQLWAYLVKKGAIANPRDFIHPCPHMSFVWGDANVAFLKARFKAMSAHHCYRGMEYSESHAQIGAWAPLIMEGRAADQPVAATHIVTGTDVDYGALTHLLFDHLAKQPGVDLHYRHRVRNLKRTDNRRWLIETEDGATGAVKQIAAKFVFIGAGGGALELLQKSDIPEGHGYGGFPVSGIWLRCDAVEVVERHDVKVYGKAAKGSPPMSVPHLDRRVIGGKTSMTRLSRWGT